MNQDDEELAAVLAEHFTHRTEEDIKEQLRVVWQSRNLSMTSK
ncbi:hypothetical protein [Rhizobium mongolense]|uniref:Uncharacterized protein n=2 Tax=Rhizobium mongolense TaxID=57676 RepID=A0ABR6IV93_9HYPH|nr:hypothetical protein [Rhizobium mongolense]MBB4231673.1 hypothetical protein [Rhizobium mongolense]TVZ64245.1 hypothetical protein BCL32_4471 [Rhizobium mongolense USDA 1844]